MTGRKIYGRLHAPGNEPSAVTVGASNTFNAPSRADDVVTTFSSRWPTRSSAVVDGVKQYDRIIKPDLAAPGNKLIAAQAARNDNVRERPGPGCTPWGKGNHKMMTLSGTPMATPHVSASYVMTNGDPTPGMPAVLDDGTTP